jgi:N-acetylmuramoyl-L-alanine amidase
VRGYLLLLFLFPLVFSCAKRRTEKTDWQTHYQTLKASRKSLPIVVLDPGHGGESSGTKTITSPVIKEKTLALQCSAKVQEFLRDWGYPVRLTRSKDETVTLQRRVAFAKEVKGYLFVSIHFNHAPNREAHGVEVFYFDNPTQAHRTERSKVLARDILRYIVRETDAYSRGVHAGNFHVIRENGLPAVLVEGGFCSNVREAKKLSDPKYIKKLAYAIARGIDAFIQNEV